MLGFHSFLRMGSTEFNEILEEIAEDIMRMDTVMRDSVTPKRGWWSLSAISHQVNPVMYKC